MILIILLVAVKVTIIMNIIMIIVIIMIIIIVTISRSTGARLSWFCHDHFLAPMASPPSHLVPMPRNHTAAEFK